MDRQTAWKVEMSASFLGTDKSDEALSVFTTILFLAFQS